ncbi:monocarboxylate transporter 13-like isoform X1 [Acanthaster planci]|uniref:Monocarboxylate transporter 13-like isoform X1 n=1 Tax=Acanthaster planci TaxID=133434 RepID=A0A8B7YGT1_ACAPL|nr:monocarboxylate transporter 13-like isoform X1 [Acanthaster planci]
MGKNRSAWRRLKRGKDPASVAAAGLAYEPPDGGWGWLVAVGSFTEMFLTMGTLLCSGVYFTPVQEEFEVSSAELGWIISSGSTLLSATCPIGSACVKRFGCRVTSLIGGSAVACGFIASSFAGSSIHIFITLGLIAGIGSGLVFVSATVILGHYFKRRYAIVNGLAFTGPGIAIFVLPPLLDYLIKNYGWRGSLLIQGAIGMHTVAAAALFRPLPSELCYRSHRKTGSKRSNLTAASYSRIEMEEFETGCSERDETKSAIDENGNRRDDDLLKEGVTESHVDSTASITSDKEMNLSKWRGSSSSICQSPSAEIGQVRDPVPADHMAFDSESGADASESNEESVDQSDAACNGSDQSKRVRRSSSDRLSFRNNCWPLYAAAFVLVCPVSFFQACAFYSVTIHLVARTGLVGVSAHLAGMSLSALGAGSSFTRLAHGWFIHRGLVSAITAYIIALIVGVIGAFGNAVSRTYVGVMIACLVIGFSSGSVYPLVPVVLRDLVSLRGLPTTYGLAMFFDSCGVFAGGFTAGLLRDVTGTYTASFCTTGVYYSIATLFLILVFFIMRLHRGREQAEAEVVPSERLENGDYQNV